VGGNAQTQAMKRVAGKLKLDMAQFRELAAFAQFGSDLDKATRDQLNRGLRITEVLKQPQYQPMSLEHQVTILFAVINGFLDDVPVNRIKVFESAFLDYMDEAHPHLGQAIASEKVLSEETETALRLAIEDFKTSETY
jgi:F-type H+-transporting ATPase subunit alpha